MVLLEGLVRGVGWIEGPIASGGIDDEAVDGSADELMLRTVLSTSVAVIEPVMLVASSVTGWSSVNVAIGASLIASIETLLAPLTLTDPSLTLKLRSTVP